MINRRTLFRIVLWIFLIWILLLIPYLFLPSNSPSIPDSVASLKSGKSLTWVYSLWDQYPWQDELEPIRRIRPSYNQYGVLPIRLDISPNNTDYPALILADVHRASLDPTALGMFNNSLSKPFGIEIKAVSTWSGVSPPWFGLAESIMLGYWTTFDRSRTTIPLRMLYQPIQETVELWPESSQWKKFANDTTFTPSNLQPFLSFRYTSPSSSTPLTDLQITFPASYFTPASPSPFYRARVVLLYFLAPPAFLVALLLVCIGYIIQLAGWAIIFVSSIICALLFCSFIVSVAWWLSKGRPSLPLKDALKMIIDAGNQRSEPTAPMNQDNTEVAPPLVDVSDDTPADAPTSPPPPRDASLAV